MYGQIPFNIPNTMALTNNKNLLSIGTSLFKKINWSSILTNTQKILNVTNQAIPLYYQVKPIFKNIKTIGKITKEFNKSGDLNLKVDNPVNSIKAFDEDIPKPVFFI